MRDRLRYWLGYIVGSYLGALWVRMRAQRPPKNGARFKIALFLLEHLGDISVSSPLIRELRVLYPQAFLTLIVPAKAFALVEKCPYADQVLVAPMAGTSREKWLRAIKWGRALSKEGFDLVLFPRADVDLECSAMLCAATAAPRRVCMSTTADLSTRLRRFLCRPFFNEMVLTPTLKHEGDRRLDIVRYLDVAAKPVLRTESWIDEKDRRYAQDYLQSINPEGRPVVAFGIGASQPRRVWAPKKYADVITSLYAEYAICPLLIVGPGERQLAEVVQRSTAVQTYCPDAPTIRQSIALMECCRLFIGNDSGPMHLAASVNIAIVEISCHPQSGDLNHANSPFKIGPIAREKYIIQPAALSPECSGGCEKDCSHCINGIDPSRVLNELKSFSRSAHAL